VDGAHQRGLYVFLDGVFGHVNKVGVSKPSPEGRLPALKSGGAGYPGQLVDYGQPESLAYFKEVARYWVEQYGIDGWRLDQAYQLGLDDWRAIRSEVAQASAARKAAGQQWGTLGYMVGEVWKGADEIRAQAYGPSDNPALSSAFDFPCATAWYRRWRWKSPARAGRGQRARRQLEQGGELPGPRHAQPDAGQPRSGALRRSAGAGQLQSGGLLAAPQGGLQLPGGPLRPHHPLLRRGVWRRGAGLCQSGGGDCAAQGLCDDHVARSDGKVPGVTGFVPSSEQSELKQWLSQLLALRAAHPALYQGERVKLVAEGSVYGDIKQTAAEQVVYLLNVSTTPQSYAVPVGKLRSGSALVDLQSGENLAIGGSSVTVDLPPLSGRFRWCAEGGRQQKGLHDGALFHGGGLLLDAAAQIVLVGRDRGLGPWRQCSSRLCTPRRRLLKLASR
jgi:hypothetical protein